MTDPHRPFRAPPGPILVSEGPGAGRARRSPSPFQDDAGRDDASALPVAPPEWDPPFCGDSAMRIAADGTWFHEGEPIPREAMVRLFAGVLRREGDGFVLVTPAEKLTIAVDDAPFLAVDVRAAAGRLAFRTNLGEIVVAGPEHPLRFELDAGGGLRPYLLVRRGLWARLTRSTALDLLDHVVERTEGEPGLESDGAFFALRPMPGDGR